MNRILCGKEKNKYTGFGGGRKFFPPETIAATAARECYEETMGIIGNIKDISRKKTYNKLKKGSDTGNWRRKINRGSRKKSRKRKKSVKNKTKRKTKQKIKKSKKKTKIIIESCEALEKPKKKKTKKKDNATIYMKESCPHSQKAYKTLTKYFGTNNVTKRHIESNEIGPIRLGLSEKFKNTEGKTVPFVIVNNKKFIGSNTEVQKIYGNESVKKKKNRT